MSHQQADMNHSSKDDENIPQPTPPSGSTVEERPFALPAKSPSKSLGASEKSFGSTDDEFFDVPNLSPPKILSAATSRHSLTTGSIVTLPLGEGNVRLLSDPVEEKVEDDIQTGLEREKSVIAHLLSQIRIGMDLTKITLPTFILERRSMLEMYADFFAHADLFARIPDHPTPKDRFIAVVRWYMSSFHAGHMSAVAKKPYNPIIGETFRCMWNVEPSSACEHVPSAVLSSGPVPWAQQSSVSFVAEQVSHHPPVAAFYAEYPARRISFCSHIWTKSKFLGLSITVQMVGEGVLFDQVHNETYKMTFPGVHARAILTTPWMEIGGKTTITCQTTGYSANIELHCKPMIGGTKNRITAELLERPNKKPFMTLDGYWNGVIRSKTREKAEVFVDVRQTPVLPKFVQLVDEQEEFESRRLWKAVTESLKDRNIKAATDGKFQLEERQRQEARERKERGVEWKHKLFHGKVGSGFTYNHPLEKRLSLARAASR